MATEPYQNLSYLSLLLRDIFKPLYLSSILDKDHVIYLRQRYHKCSYLYWFPFDWAQQEVQIS